MFTEYAFRNIDNRFATKLNSYNSTKNQLPQKPQKMFNRQTIKKSLHSVIRKESQNGEKEGRQKSLSPISKSRLKIILQFNREQRINSVVRRSVSQNKSQNRSQKRSPYTKIENQGRYLKSVNDEEDCSAQINKENDIIRYYRDQRKSTQKVERLERSKSTKARRSRIFNRNNCTLSPNVSNFKGRD